MNIYHLLQFIGRSDIRLAMGAFFYDHSGGWIYVVTGNWTPLYQRVTLQTVPTFQLVFTVSVNSNCSR